MNQTKYIGAIDQGTSSSRFCIFDTTGKLIAHKSSPLEHQVPKSGWVQQNPNAILQSVKESIELVYRDYKDLKELSCIGITNQRETIIAWDKKSGKPLHDAIVWSDLRSMDQCKQIENKQPSKGWITEKTGLKIHPYFSAPKIMWLIQNSEEVKTAIKEERCLIGTVDSWLLYNMTGEHYTDVTNASRTMLMNLQSCEWDDEILKALDLPRNVLPNIKSNSDDFGTIKPEFSKWLSGLKVTGCIGDQQSALVGQGCLSAGGCKNTYGTGLFLLLNIGEKIIHSKHEMITTVGYRMGGKTFYAFEGSVATAGSGISWLKDSLQLITDPKQISEFGEDNGNVYLVPAFTGLLAPHWEPLAKGVVIGLSNSTTRKHISRAMLESLAFSTNDVLSAMKDDCNIEIKNLQVDGGVSASDSLLQFQSDILNIPVIRSSESVEATAFGAAFASGVTLGLFSVNDQLSKPLDTFSPKISESKRKQLLHNWNIAVKCSLLLKEMDVDTN